MNAGATLARCRRRIAAPVLLHLMRLASPSLPVGGFSYSDGFEAAFEAGHVGGEAQALGLLRAAYHLGNRHVPLEVRPDRLQLEPDHVLAEMLGRMGLHVEAAEAAFEPEAGAYDASSLAHGHDHEPGHDHGHEHDHAPGHGNEHGHAHGHENVHEHDATCGPDHGHKHEHR
jgi:urease accessory protein